MLRKDRYLSLLKHLVNEWMNKMIYEYGWEGGCMDEWMNRRMDERTSEGTNKRINEHKNGRTYEIYD